MMAFLYGEEALKNFQSERSESIEVESQDQESLLVEWLSELLALSNTNYRLYSNIRINKISERKLKATIDSESAQAKDDIKAVTYSELSLKKNKSFWEAIVVYDI